MSATTQSPHESGGDKGFTASVAYVAECRGGKAEGNRRSIARLTRSLPCIFPSAVLSRALSRPFVPPTPRLAIDSYWGAHALRADRLARASPRGAECPPAGGGGSEIAARMACRPHSECHQRPIANAYTRRGQNSVVYAGNQFIASAGMPIYGTPVPTRMRPGTAPVRLHGNSGLRHVTTSGS